MLKRIVVETERGFKMFNKPIRNGEVNIFNIRQIGEILKQRNIKVYEVNESGTQRVRVTRENYLVETKFVPEAKVEVKIETKPEAKVEAKVEVQPEVEEELETSYCEGYSENQYTEEAEEEVTEEVAEEAVEETTEEVVAEKVAEEAVEETTEEVVEETTEKEKTFAELFNDVNATFGTNSEYLNEPFDTEK